MLTLKLLKCFQFFGHQTFGQWFVSMTYEAETSVSPLANFLSHVLYGVPTKSETFWETLRALKLFISCSIFVYTGVFLYSYMCRAHKHLQSFVPP